MISELRGQEFVVLGIVKVEELHHLIVLAHGLVDRAWLLQLSPRVSSLAGNMRPGTRHLVSPLASVLWELSALFVR